MVSVIITTYRRPGLLPRAINSALMQTWRDFELIVVDDASADDTESVVAEFDDSRMQYVRHDVNRGGPAARNTGIRMAKGKYIALLDDDDEWHAAKLERQVNVFKEAASGVGVVYSGFEVCGENGEFVATALPTNKGDLHMNLLQRNMIGGSSIPLIKMQCFGKVGLFDESLTSCQDWDMWLRISREYEFDYVREVLTRGHFHGDQISEDFSAMIPGRARMIEKHMTEFTQYPNILVAHLKRMGKMHCLNGTWKEAICWFRKALAVDIFEIVNVLAWCVIELPRVAVSTRAKTFKKYYPEDG
ncbi:MAG: glycosyltransferase [Thermodesulfobacteriota bacterium]|nr:glycosyltransferase [Thermodesulfobacteriota bacterium]